MEELLQKLGPELAFKVVTKALLAGAKPIVNEAKRLVHVRSGELRDSITATAETKQKAGISAEDGERKIFIGFKKPTSRRAHLTEFGTSHSAAFPFMRPAMDSKAGEALDEMGRVLAEGIEKAAKDLAK